jgi:hypothetical protein
VVYTAAMVACLYDVHGNLPALEAVLPDAARAECDVEASAAEVASLGPWGENVAGWLRAARGLG